MSPRGAVELFTYRGALLSTLGRHREAADALTWVLERMDRSKVMWRAAVAADRDAALTQPLIARLVSVHLTRDERSAHR